MSLYGWDDVQREGGQCHEILDYHVDVCRHGGIQLGGGLRVDGNFDAEVLDPFCMLWQKKRIVRNLVELGRVVELLSGVKDWERFGTNGLTCPNYCVMEKGDVRRLGGFWVCLAAQYRFVCTVEESFVNSTTNFYW